MGNVSGNLFHDYLADIEQYPALSRDGENRLGRAIDASKEARLEMESAGVALPDEHLSRLGVIARDGALANRALVQSNLRLVVKIAEEYRASGLPILDLVQEGNLGLMHAVETFDWRRGFRFSTYASWWVRQAVRRGIANSVRSVDSEHTNEGSRPERSRGEDSDEAGKSTGCGTAEPTARGRAGLECTFCGRTQGDGFKLIAGAGVYICDLCIALSDDVLTTGEARTRGRIQLVPVGPGEAETKCSFCGKRRDLVGGLVSGTAVQICNECVDLCQEILDE